jgi:4-amino-4-deoxy-L-arabinose transferase-like glycosyltransferase
VIGRLRRVPGPLAILLVVGAVEALAWCVALPALQGPDEVSHYTYVERIVERGTIPWKPGGDDGKSPAYPHSTETLTALTKAELGSLTANVAARAAWTPADVALWTRADRRLGARDREDGGYTGALKNPPAYYLYEAVPYAVARGTFFDRLFAMRLANIPLFLATIAFTWLLAAQLLPAPLWPRFVAAGSVMLQPQLLNVTATVNPDVLLTAASSAALWLMVLICRRGPRLPLVAALAVSLAVAGLTHGRGLLLVPPAVLAVLIAVGRERRWRLPRPRLVVPALMLGALVCVAAVASRGDGSPREFVSYVWQFYLPKLGFMDPAIGVSDYDFGEVYVGRFYGTLAQLEVTLPHTLDRVLLWATLAGLVALVAALVAQRDAVRRNADVAAVLLVAVASLVLGIHAVAYRAMVVQPGDPIITGRYLLPLVPLFGAAIAVVARALPRRAAAGFAGAVLAAGVCLQWTSLGLLLERFHA